MDGSYVMLAIVSVVIWAGILSMIIGNATKAKENILLQRAQLSILIEMAIKSNVSLERIGKILDENSTTDQKLVKKEIKNLKTN